MVQTIISAVATNEVLNRFQPIEKIPMVGAFAGEVQLVVGIMAAYGIVIPKSENQIVKGIAIGMIASGATKVLNKYLPK